MGDGDTMRPRPLKVIATALKGAVATDALRPSLELRVIAGSAAATRAVAGLKMLIAQLGLPLPPA